MKLYEIVCAHQPQPWVCAQLERFGQDRRITRYANSQPNMRLYAPRLFSDCTIFDVREAADMVERGICDGIVIATPAVARELPSWDRAQRYLEEHNVPIIFVSSAVEKADIYDEKRQEVIN